MTISTPLFMCCFTIIHCAVTMSEHTYFVLKHQYIARDENNKLLPKSTKGPIEKLTVKVVIYMLVNRGKFAYSFNFLSWLIVRLCIQRFRL